MAITVRCKNCGKKYSVADTLAGKRGKCKACGTVFVVPVPAPEFDEVPMIASDEPDLSALSVADEGEPFGSVMASSVSRTGIHVPSAERTEQSDEAHAAGGGDAFTARMPPTALGAFDQYLPRILIVLCLGLPTLLSVKFALAQPQPWLPLTGLGVFLALSFLLVLPVSSLGLASAMKKLRIGPMMGSQGRLMAAIALPLCGVILGYWLGGPQGMIAGAIIGLVPGAIALTYLFSLTMTEAAVAVASVALAWVVSTGLAVGFAFAAGFAVNMVVQTIEKPRPGPTVAVAPKPPAKVSAPDSTTSPVVESAVPGSAMIPTTGSTTAPVLPTLVSETPTEPVGPSAREKSVSNLIEIGQKLFSDAEQHGGNLAHDLATLATRTGLSVASLDSPAGRASTGVDYRYVLAGVSAQLPLPPDLVVVYDFADAEATGGANVLSGDGRVNFVDSDHLPALLRKTRDVLPPPGALMQGLGKVVQGGASAVPAPVGPAEALTPPFEPDPTTRPAWMTSVQNLPVSVQANDVMLPALRSPFIATLTHGSDDEEIIQRWNVITKEPGPKISFKRDPAAIAKYIVAPEGDCMVRLVTWPKLAAQVWAFDGAKMVKTIDLSASAATPRLVGFVTPAQFCVLWEQPGLRGVEVWDARTGMRGKQTVLPDFSADHGNFNATGDGKQFGVATQADKKVVQIIDVTGLRGTKRLPVTSIDAKWPLKTGGISVSPDGSKVAALFEHDRDALLVTWRLSDGKILSEIPCPAGSVPAGADGFVGSAVHWMDDEGPWLVYGNVIDKNGMKIASVGETDRSSHAQAIIGRECGVVTVSGDEGKTFDVVVVKYAAPKTAGQ